MSEYFLKLIYMYESILKVIFRKKKKNDFIITTMANT